MRRFMKGTLFWVEVGGVFHLGVKLELKAKV